MLWCRSFVGSGPFVIRNISQKRWILRPVNCRSTRPAYFKVGRNALLTLTANPVVNSIDLFRIAPLAEVVESRLSGRS